MITQETEEGTHVAYECDMFMTVAEKEFYDDSQAMNFYESNFAIEFRVAEEIESLRNRKAASDEARMLLDEFDYVITKLSEGEMLLIREFAQRIAAGESVSFTDFILKMNESIIAAEQDKGASFFSDRADQRDIVNGLQPRSMKL